MYTFIYIMYIYIYHVFVSICNTHIYIYISIHVRIYIYNMYLCNLQYEGESWEYSAGISEDLRQVTSGVKATINRDILADPL